MKRTVLSLFLLLAPVVIMMAQYSIRIQVDSMPNRKAFLLEFIGVNTQLVDSARVEADGRFQFLLPENAHPGMYRIVVGPNNFWDILFNREPVELRTHYASLVDSLKVISSEDNKLLKEYMHFYITLNRKSEALQQLLRLYPASDPFHRQLRTELQKINQTDQESISREIIAKNPGSYAARFLKAELSPAIPADLPPEEELSYVLDHFFDNINFTDTALLYSPPLIGKVRSFFSLIPQANPPAMVEEAMKLGLDRLMSMAVVNDVLYQYILEDISKWAERSEYEEFFAYLTEFYLTGAACKDEERAGELEEILESIRKTAVGTKAPEMILPMDTGVPVILSDIPARYKLVLFWATWCPHCTQMLPEIKRIYQTYRFAGFEVVAISLDQVRSEWQKTIANGGYDWINYSELKGWDCTIAHDYGIRATPTMILMSRDRTILAKPRNPQMLEQKLREVMSAPVR